ncbi:MAG TPA: CHAD domain-containing protein [Thermoleophilaceae bacterium]|jgi:CHAD domain-containing protein
MARARAIPGLAESASFSAAAARVVAVRSEEVFEHADHVLDTTDVERVHDMRVATRRLRAALELFAVCFPKGQHRKALREVKRLADALGERRDPDVAIEGFEKVRAALPAADRAGIGALIDELRERQAGANVALAEAIEHARRSGLHERLVALTAAAEAA